MWEEMTLAPVEVERNSRNAILGRQNIRRARTVGSTPAKEASATVSFKYY